MSIKKVTNAISNRARDFANYTSRRLSDTAVKAMGVVSILIGLLIWGALAFGLYKFAMFTGMEHWHSARQYVPGSFVFAMLTIVGTTGACLLSSGPFIYGKTMLSAKRIVGPKQSLGEL